MGKYSFVDYFLAGEFLLKKQKGNAQITKAGNLLYTLINMNIKSNPQYYKKSILYEILKYMI